MAVLGYQVFLADGQVGLQLAEGTGSNICSFDPTTSACANYLSNAFVADGEWHFVAVTVDRDDPQGGRWYLDGDERNPPSRARSRRSGPGSSVCPSRPDQLSSISTAVAYVS